jgi:hypothetical protein
MRQHTREEVKCNCDPARFYDRRYLSICVHSVMLSMLFIRDMNNFPLGFPIKLLHSFLIPESHAKWNSSQLILNHSFIAQEISSALVSSGRGFPNYSQTHHSRQDFSARGIGPSQRPLPDNTQLSQQTIIHAPCGIRTRNPSKRAAADPRLRTLAYWEWPFDHLMALKCMVKCKLQIHYEVSHYERFNA